MKKIKEMIASAPTRMEAVKMLDIFRVFGNITEDQYNKGRELITKEFS